MELFLSSFLMAFANILNIVINLYIWIIIISALASWMGADPFNPIVQLLRRLTEPVYNLIRRRIRTDFGGIDIAPLIVILFLEFCQMFFVSFFSGLASGL